QPGRRLDVVEDPVAVDQFRAAFPTGLVTDEGSPWATVPFLSGPDCASGHVHPPDESLAAQLQEVGDSMPQPTAEIDDLAGARPPRAEPQRVLHPLAGEIVAALPREGHAPFAGRLVVLDVLVEQCLWAIAGG